MANHLVAAPPSVASSAVLWRAGVQIAGTVVWCDAPRRREVCFLSHAAVGAAAAGHGRLLTSPRTAALLRVAGHPPTGDLLVTPFGRSFSLGPARLELFPSGHLPGAASLAIEIDGRRIVYAGTVNRFGAESVAEPTEVRPADVVVAEAPLALCQGRLPPPKEGRARLRAAIERALEERVLPVLLAPALGLAEELLLVLGTMGLAMFVHPAVAAYADAYRSFGIALPPLRRFSGVRRLTSVEPRVLVWPLSERHSSVLGRLGPVRRIAAGGRAFDRKAAEKLHVDEVVPIANQVDLAGLAEYVACSGARELYLTAGYGPEVARALRGRRLRRVEPLGPPHQMDLFR